MENNILSENGLIRLTSLEIYPTFFLGPNRLILNYYKWNEAEITMELPVFIEYLKVEPWEWQMRERFVSWILMSWRENL